MEQRPLRLGDIVDDYCPRERRITNHIVVALVEDSIRQTRCSTCEAEHAYKDGREPKRRRKDSDGVDLSGGILVPARRPASGDSREPDGATDGRADDMAAAGGSELLDPAESDADKGEMPSAESLGHRRLIRATLPRTGAEPPVPRPIPEFTMHQRPQGRGRGFRGGPQPGWRGGSGQADGNSFRSGGGDSNANGNVNGNGPGPGPSHGPGGPGKPGRHRGRHRRSR